MFSEPRQYTELPPEDVDAGNRGPIFYNLRKGASGVSF
jgi:hypothetical protein